jgi:tetratricopeptide (TPR) repeat protein
MLRSSFFAMRALGLPVLALLLAVAPARAQQSGDGAKQKDSQAARFRLAQRYLDADKPERAIALLEDLHAEHPSTSAFYKKLKSAYEKQKRYGDAIALVERRMERRGRSPALLSEKARLQYHGDAGEKTAFATWDEALAAAPQQAQTYRTVHGSLTDARLFRQAIDAVKKGREALGKPALMRLQMAHLYSLTSQYERAIEEYLTFVKNNPDRLTFVKRRLGRFMKQEEALQESIAATSRAVREEPMQRPYRELMGWLYLQADEHQKAFDAYRAIDRLAGADGRLLHSFAKQAADAGAYRAALDAYRLVRERHPESPVAPDALRGIGRMNERRAEQSDDTEKRQKWHEKALDAYRTFLDKYPEHEAYPSVLRAVGRLQQDVLFDLAAAEKTLQQVAERYPKTRAAHRARYDLGRLHVMRGNLTEARLAFSRLAERLGDSGDLAQKARYQQALLHFYQGEFDAASTLISTIAENTDADVSNDGIDLGVLLGENAASRDTTGQALQLFARARLKHRRRQKAETLALVDELLTSHPRSPLADDARFFKARALASHSGRTADEAAEAYAQVALTHPKSPLADRGLYRAARLRETALDDPQAALESYQRLLEDYPGSLHAADARNRIRALQKETTSETDETPGPAS